MEKYSSFSSYISNLNSSLKSFESGLTYCVNDKYTKSLKVSLQSLSIIIDNLISIKEYMDTMDKISKIESNDVQAKKINSKISDIRTELKNNYTELKQEFLKAIDTVFKQSNRVLNGIKKPEDRKSFLTYAHDFMIMCNETKSNPSIAHFDEKKSYMDEMKKMGDNAEKNASLNLESNGNNREINKLDDAFARLYSSMAESSTDPNIEEVKREYRGIKQVLSPKVISIAKENIDRLRNCRSLSIDLDGINDLLETPYSFRGKNGKLKRVQRHIEDLRKFLANVKKSNTLQETKLDLKLRVVEEQVDLATSAIKKYVEVLDYNNQIAREKNEIRDGNHYLISHNKYLKQLADKFNEIAREIRRKPYQEFNDGLKAYYAHEEADKYTNDIRENQKYLNEVNQSIIKTIPPEYSKIKEKLKAISRLSNLNIMSKGENDAEKSRSI